jgi:hypothetical protein
MGTPSAGPHMGGQLDPAICAKWHLPNEHAQICLSAHPTHPTVWPFSDAASGCTRQSKNLNCPINPSWVFFDRNPLAPVKFTAGSPQRFQARSHGCSKFRYWYRRIFAHVLLLILDRTTPIQYPNKK